MNKHLVFVYGTLRRGSARGMSIRFPSSEFIAEAKVTGSLYDLGAYPGLILNESNSLVVGEVYEVDDETLNELDDFEATSNYWRKPVEISFGTSRRMCWTGFARKVQEAIREAVSEPEAVATGSVGQEVT